MSERDWKSERKKIREERIKMIENVFEQMRKKQRHLVFTVQNPLKDRVKRWSIYHKFNVPSGSGLKLLAYYYGEKGFGDYLEKFIENLPEKKILCLKWNYRKIEERGSS